MGTNLQESSAYWFKLTNEILDINGNITLCEVPFCKIFMWLLKICNQFHNILRLFGVLPNFSFTTSEPICNYYL